MVVEYAQIQQLHLINGIQQFSAIPGCDVQGKVKNEFVKVNSQSWRENLGFFLDWNVDDGILSKTNAYIAINGQIKGVIALADFCSISLVLK